MVVSNDLENRLLAEIAENGTVLREYVWLGQEPVALREYEVRPGLYFYINDHLGTPQRLITGEGTVVWQAAALPFGRTQVQLGTVQNNLRFPGQYFDAETGLHYNWNRYYDPETGRYLSPDPIGLEGGLNLYAYVENDPVNWVDKEGLKVWKCKRPLNGLPGDFTPPFRNHAYICTTTKDNHIACESTTPSTVKPVGELFYPGTSARPSTYKDGDYYHKKACKEVDIPEPWYNGCFEICIETYITMSYRPHFAIGPAGTDCQEWTDNIILSCQSACSRLTRPSYRYGH